MGTLDPKALVRECASALFWRRQTAQRLLAERGQNPLIPSFSPSGGEGARRAVEGDSGRLRVKLRTQCIETLRELLADKNAEPYAIIIALRTLEQLGALMPSDLQPFI